jgi:hypothetical protein
MGTCYCYRKSVGMSFMNRLSRLLTFMDHSQPKSTTSFNPPSLTISSFPPPLASTPESIPSPTLVHVLSLLLPLSLHVPLSLKLLNESLFEPESKDEDLFSGVLQLPASTTIIVSDSQITDGTLKEKG